MDSFLSPILFFFSLFYSRLGKNVKKNFKKKGIITRFFGSGGFALIYFFYVREESRLIREIDQ